MSSPAHAIYSSTLGLSLTESVLLCAAICTQNPSSRLFDYDSSSHRCRLFEADLTNGAIIAVGSQMSIVGSVILSASLYASMYNQSCSACQENRYQTCSSTTNACQCPGNSYWNGSMCPLTLFQNVACHQIDACRSDLNLSCIINYYGEFTQCSIEQVLTNSTETAYAVWNTTAGSDSNLASSGTGIGKYYPQQGSGNIFDHNTNTKYVSFGDCKNITAGSPTCAQNTGFYLTLQRGASLLVAF
ncbi:unnamed protein product [Rotaria magnacalcarata]|uniref:Uncharacterized protein n=1 Tax=Rotaria magnacalcarata TaxID=392030 RepID=A0A815K1W9_9BILA|nr:unnamed protein product [Rotaria magnacalcarata]CAF4014147.1 unnamed protein product [Rotaria magnacalcarata]